MAEVEVQVKEPMVSIRRCTCQHTYQDKQYGVGQRVHNRTEQAKPTAARKWRCTVCGIERE